MRRAQNPNIEILMLAVHKLEELADDMVFLGGCAAGLLITDSASPPVRVTKDVDAIVQVTSKHDYYQLSERLRAKGFSEDTRDDAPICRWVNDGVILDVMPTEPDVLGFGNEWYSLASENTFDYVLPSDKIIKVVTAPYFLITKIEAFKGRGNGDYMFSHDIEDLIAVLEGRPELLDEVRNNDDVIHQALAKRFGELMTEQDFIESISGHLPSDTTSQQRVPHILGVIDSIIALK